MSGCHNNLGKDIAESAINFENCVAALICAEANKINALIDKGCSCSQLVDANEAIADILDKLAGLEESIVDKLCKGLKLYD